MPVLDQESLIFIDGPLVWECHQKKDQIEPMKLKFCEGCLEITMIGVIVYEIKVDTKKLPPDGSKEIHELIELIKFHTEKQKLQQAYVVKNAKYLQEFPSIGETIG